MKLAEKKAVLKLAGFEVRKMDIGLWEWELPRKNAPDGQHRLGKESYKYPQSAWCSAWRYMTGDASEEFDNDPWIN